MDFVAIDFETANSRADSACQLAAVRVERGEIVDHRKWMIKPKRNYFAPRNISIHGIRPEHVTGAPNMEQLWPEFQQFIDGHVLVAHNAAFDIGVLVASLASHDIACPFLEFSCTRAIARRAWPGRSRYGLKPLGTWWVFSSNIMMRSKMPCAARASRWRLQKPCPPRALCTLRKNYACRAASTALDASRASRDWHTFVPANHDDIADGFG